MLHQESWMLCKVLTSRSHKSRESDRGYGTVIKVNFPQNKTHWISQVSEANT